MYAGNNQLVGLPEFGLLTNLRELDVSNNCIRHLPPSIGACKRLRMLWLSDNLLTSLPSTIGNISKLRVLHVRGNGLMHLPYTVTRLSHIRELYFSDNPLQWCASEDAFPPEPPSLVELAARTVLLRLHRRLLRAKDGDSRAFQRRLVRTLAAVPVEIATIIERSVRSPRLCSLCDQPLLTWIGRAVRVVPIPNNATMRAPVLLELCSAAHQTSFGE